MRVIFGDSRDMKEVEDNSVSLVLTSPPYYNAPFDFPEELARRIITLYSYVGDTVLDPFAGTGTTLKVANELKRNAIGY